MNAMKDGTQIVAAVGGDEEEEKERKKSQHYSHVVSSGSCFVPRAAIISAPRPIESGGRHVWPCAMFDLPTSNNEIEIEKKRGGEDRERNNTEYVLPAIRSSNKA